MLQQWLKSQENPRFALQAANVLDRLGDRALPALPMMKEVLADSLAPGKNGGGDEYIQRILTRSISVIEGKTPAWVTSPRLGG